MQCECLQARNKINVNDYYNEEKNFYDKHSFINNFERISNITNNIEKINNKNVIFYYYLLCHTFSFDSQNRAKYFVTKYKIDTK